MSRRKGGTPLFSFLIVLAMAVGYCSKPDSQKSPDASSQDLVTSSAPAQAPSPSSPSSVAAPIQYVKPVRLNVRDAPDGKVIDSLVRGTPVGVYEHRSRWVRISRDGFPEQWVSGPNLCSGGGCAEVATPPARSASTDLAHSLAPVESRRYQSNVARSFDCPCSRMVNCVGPRGGRYCITSGGNKRYR